MSVIVTKINIDLAIDIDSASIDIIECENHGSAASQVEAALYNSVIEQASLTGVASAHAENIAD